ncbi:hypothetical protein E1A91_A12G224500v1 [Gossypium mustelinum]|uniref:Uncharacterized protein n=4 Tax=Gossypium TaxID=3633 RepID=A0A2P5WKR8_GOSBA|nr:uncharacterized protein LOC108477721 [Gossypium arboreum]KAB2053906.1 hypothetical protein ES319_A12G218400v1 [Gossypium barbadense]TYG91125.1 hypothetical protein ES288_A12G238100v1 [Gossypium darwinii]TYH97367.1 hypothetical protein ES332_A12G238600v1 [Gossypium tomentosum]TYJ06304.1 hypothetical protein E1A91_A12G224500v1 [Gossypium mustelinum]PPR91686.1 hypothetical protein GOBAR_AA29005 [Gossypium barbadense]
MSFNCLTFQVLEENDSINEKDPFGKQKKVTFCCVSRTWSGHYEQIRSEAMPVTGDPKKIKEGHRRLNTIHTIYESKGYEADAQPRLVRSCGMRRDWSFEDLSDEKMRKEMSVG